MRGFPGVSALLSCVPVNDLLVAVSESYEHTQHVSCCLEPCCPNPACFHYPKYFQPKMQVEVPKSQWSCGVQGVDPGGEVGARAGGAARGAPHLPHRTHPPFQLCCCCAHKKKGPVCQPLDCLPDSQAVRLPVVRAWVWEGALEQLSLELLCQGDGEREQGRMG